METVKRVGAVIRVKGGGVFAGITGEVVKVEAKGVRVKWIDGLVEYLHLEGRWALAFIEVVS